jgi:transposase
MIFPSNRVRIMVATKPVDFREGHDGLAALVKNELHKDPFTGTVFVFRSRKADRLKLIYWDGSGIVMAYKRLEEHTFTWPTIKDGLMTLTHAQFEALFAGLDWRRVGNSPRQLTGFKSRILSGFMIEEILMKASKFSESQILAILRQAEGGVPVPELCHGMSTASE